MKYGLVMEGGAMRGMFTAGVIDVLMENGIKFDGAVGVSAGACFGCNYKSEQKGRAIRYNLRFCQNKKYCSIQSLITTGDMFGAEFCYHKLPDELDIFDVETFENNPMEFYTVATDVETGKAIYHKIKKVNYNELEWIRASASLPLASRIVEVDGKKLLDGSIADSVPLRFMQSLGYEKNIVILTQPRGYVKRKNKMTPVIKAVYRKYPGLVRAFENRPRVYNSQLKYIRKEEQEGRAFVIAPPEKLPIGHTSHDHDELLEVYRTGRETANRDLHRIIKFLNCNTL